MPPKDTTKWLEWVLNRDHVAYKHVALTTQPRCRQWQVHPRRHLNNQESKTVTATESHTKTVTAAFHLNNREAKRELNVYNNDGLFPFCPTPTYPGVKLDRSLTFRHHLVALRKKLSSRITLLRRLVGSRWGAGAKTLHIAPYL